MTPEITLHMAQDLLNKGQAGPARAALERLGGWLERDPGGLCLLARALAETGGNPAVPLLKALAVDPAHASARRLLAAHARSLVADDLDQAISLFRTLANGDDAALTELAMMLIEGALWSEADKVLERVPDASRSVIWWMCRSRLSRQLLDVAGALEAARQAAELAPEQADIQVDICYLLATHRPERVDERALAARRLSSMIQSTQPLPPLSPAKGPDRPLKIAVLGACFQNHPGYKTIEMWLTGHDPAEGEIHLYDRGGPGDAATARLFEHAAGYRAVAGWEARRLAQTLRADGIDVAVDMIWLTKGHVLGAFAERVAPVQAVWVHADGFTGTPGVDWWIANGVAVPADSDDPEPEQVLREHEGPVYGYAPLATAPEPRAKADGEPLTFGCFNTHWKLNARTFELWAKAMAPFPDSKLVLKSISLTDPLLSSRIFEMAGAAGIAAERVILSDRLPLKDHFELFHQIDIMLDTVPFTGGQSVAEALWMGVPMLSLVGARPPERLAATFYHHSGVPEWCCEDEATFIDQVARLGRNKPWRDRLRRDLRPQLAKSSLLDGARLARTMDAAVRRIWRKETADAGGG